MHQLVPVSWLFMTRSIFGRGPRMRSYTACKPACTVQGILVSLKASWLKHVYTNLSKRKRYISLWTWKDFQFERCPALRNLGPEVWRTENLDKGRLVLIQDAGGRPHMPWGISPSKITVTMPVSRLVRRYGHHFWYSSLSLLWTMERLKWMFWRTKHKRYTISITKYIYIYIALPIIGRWLG